MGAQNFKFAPKFPKMGVLAQILHFWTKNRQFSDSPKFRGEGQLPTCPSPASTPVADTLGGRTVVEGTDGVCRRRVAWTVLCPCC